MDLNNDQLNRLHRALISSIPTRADLERFALFKLSTPLEEIVPPDTQLDSAVTTLIKSAKDKGTLDDLLRAAIESYPGCEDLRELWREVTQSRSSQAW